MPLKVNNFAKYSDMELFLRGGIKTGPVPPLTKGRALGLHGLTLVFIQPAAKTVTFSDATGEGLSLLDILQQINLGLDNVAVTTEGTSALSTLTMASETLTLFIDGVQKDITFGTEAGEVAILAILNAAHISPTSGGLGGLGVTATAGGGTPGGLVLTTDDGGAQKSIQITATGGGQAKLTAAVETVTGTDSVVPRFNGGFLELVEAVPLNGVSVNLQTSTALTAFGWSGELAVGSTHAGTVYNPTDGTAPRYLDWTGTSDASGYLVLTEEV